MRFRVWHLLAGMVFVGCWVPISKWLLALEAKDHPELPQTSAEFVGFYGGSIVFVGMPLVVAWIIVCRLRAGRTPAEGEQGHNSPADSA